jgi:hypothetical protein
MCAVNAAERCLAASPAGDRDAAVQKLPPDVVLTSAGRTAGVTPRAELKAERLVSLDGMFPGVYVLPERPVLTLKHTVLAGERVVS